MRYERPTIIRRELISALLDNAKSDNGPDGQVSDVRRKENIRPVTWGAARVQYSAPAIARREVVAGLLTVAKSEKQQRPTSDSDVHIKDNIVPVTWGSTTRVAYTKPAFSHREPLTGLLIVAKSEKTNDAGTGASDRNIKDNIVPVRW